jgi:alanine racemase
VYRSEVTIDLGALRRNVRRMREAAAPAELWAVVKADAYGHGAAEVARVCLDEGAAALCVATVREGASLRETATTARIVVMSPLGRGEGALAREAGLELCMSSPDVPAGVPVHLKVDTGMGRWGMSADDALTIPLEQVVGLMSHFATADEGDQGFAREQLARFQAIRERFRGVTAHMANSAATLALPDARFDAVRSGIALYGLSPFGDDPAKHGLEPVLSWRSSVTLTKTLQVGESTGYGRRFVAARSTRIGLVPVGYADGFRRGLSGADVLVGGSRRRVLGTVSMDSFAVELGDETEGAPVALIGDGILAEEHARHLGTINYEITCAVRADPLRANRSIVDG